MAICSGLFIQTLARLLLSVLTVKGQPLMVRNVLLFIVFCGLSGICILVGSVVGHGFGKTGLFSGAVIGGIVGIALASWLATRFGLLDKISSGMTFLGALVGFAVAVAITLRNLRTPFIPVASVGFIGLGAVLGKAISRTRNVV
jgi:uncharacterized membrane protein YeaQ/YmgE (transglycosylase-associated protein family)